MSDYLEGLLTGVAMGVLGYKFASDGSLRRIIADVVEKGPELYQELIYHLHEDGEAE